MTKPEIGFVGLGAMGFGMATHLTKQGYRVHGFDAFAASVDRFAQAGGQPAASLGASAKDKQFYICMVATAQQAQKAIFGKDGIAHSLPNKAILLLCSTVPASYAISASEQFATQYPEKEILLVDCPVSGGTKKAAEGTLSIMAGASDEAIDRTRFLLEEMSDTKEDKLYIVPGGVGAGSNMKMVHQVLAAIHVLGAGEAMGFAARLGLNGDQTYASILQSDAWTWMFENRTPRMLSEQWSPEVSASATTIMLKDVGIVTLTARSHSFPMPLASTAEQVYLSAVSQGLGSYDDSIMLRQYFPASVRRVEQTDAQNIHLVQDLMRGINLCAAVEAISFARSLNVDLQMYYKLVTNAAAASRVFTTDGLGLIQGKTATALEGTGVIDKLQTATQKARDLNCPLYLGNAALTVLELAKRKGTIAKVFE